MKLIYLTQKKISLVIVFLSLLLSSFTTTSPTSEWELNRNEHGIKVYTRSIKGYPIKEVKVVTDIPSSLTSVTAALKDVVSYKSWIYGCKESKLLKVVSDSEFYYYTLTETPWPVMNRDLVMHTKITQDPKTKTVYFKSTSASKLIPENKDVIRINKAETSWTFEPNQSNGITATYIARVDPAGSFPDWLVNSLLIYGPHDTMTKLKQISQSLRYKSVKYSFIEEIK